MRRRVLRALAEAEDRLVEAGLPVDEVSQLVDGFEAAVEELLDEYSDEESDETDDNTDDEDAEADDGDEDGDDEASETDDSGRSKDGYRVG